MSAVTATGARGGAGARMVHLTLAIGRFFEIMLGALLGAAVSAMLAGALAIGVAAALFCGLRAIWRVIRRRWR